jgi:hypothetical protein
VYKKGAHAPARGKLPSFSTLKDAPFYKQIKRYAGVLKKNKLRDESAHIKPKTVEQFKKGESCYIYSPN